MLKGKVAIITGGTRGIGYSTVRNMVAALPDKVIEPLINRIPLRRIGEPEDIANAFLSWQVIWQAMSQERFYQLMVQ